MRVRNLVVASILAASALAGPAPGVAEDLDPAALFESAKAAYAEKKYGKSLGELKLLIGEIARRRGDQLKTHLPAAPAGWTAEDAEAQADYAGLMFLNAGFVLRQRYRKGEAEVSLELIVDSPMVAAMAASMSMAQMAGLTVVRLKGRQAVLEHDAANKSGNVKLVLGGNTALLTLTGNGVTKQELVDGFGGALDLDALDKGLLE